MNHFVTTNSVTSFAICPRRAFFVLRGEHEETPHEYELVVEERAASRRLQYLSDLPDNEIGAFQKGIPLGPFPRQLDPGRLLFVEDLAATCDALVRKRQPTGKAPNVYEPHLVVGVDTISKDQKLALAYAGYVVGQSKPPLPAAGLAVPLHGPPQQVRLSPLYSEVRAIVTTLRTYAIEPADATPPLNMAHRCETCPFRAHCLQEAKETDSLTLLERMSSRLLRRYAKKGVFTVNQLSYLFRPRRRRKRSPAAQPSFNIELQALAIRTGKIYLNEPPTLEERPVELYLDVEGIPDQDFQYLIGLSIKSRDSLAMQSFWADNAEDERRIFQECIDAAGVFPDAPIYHYGNYERRAFEQAVKKYGMKCQAFMDRLVNVNSFVFGKIYFPARSNRLKDLGVLVGASWSGSDLSGLQSIAWRFRWEDTGDEKYKQMLLSYNRDDCDAVRLLTREIQHLAKSANSRPDVDFPTTSKTNTTENGQVIHDAFDSILKSAHLKYQQKRIKVRPDVGKGHQGSSPKPKRPRRVPRTMPQNRRKVIRVPRKRKCPNCPGQELRRSRKIVEHDLLDLSFTRSGCRKIVVRHVGNYARCQACGYYYSPPGIKKLRRQLFGRNFKCWTTYVRITLRLPIRLISQVIEVMFSEHISASEVGEFISFTACEYATTEKLLLDRLRQSAVVHADETTINIRGVSHYAWVLTDGKHVVFKLSETRQISTIQPLLDGYGDVLVSDFYGGYDSLPCKQQKCLVHLIRDLNDDLWSNPFNEDYERFVCNVRDLLVPVFEDVNRWGLKARFLKKHMKAVNQFYGRVIEANECRSELVEKYRKRFTRYRESLFRFLTEDGIPWNNNMAERALRHLAVQQNISGCFVGSGAIDYLRLLGISQTCRFQDKPFLQFLLSGERDVDPFTIRKRRRKTGSV